MAALAFLINAGRGAFLDAWVLMLLWRWFAAPLGAPALGYWQAMGVDLLVGFFLMPVFLLITSHGTEKKLSGNDDVARAVAKVVVALTVVGIGALISLAVR